MLFHDGKFQWKRLRNLIALAKDGAGGLDLSDTVSDGARVLLLDARLRTQLLLALTEDNRLHLRVSKRAASHSQVNVLQARDRSEGSGYRGAAGPVCARPVLPLLCGGW